MPGISDLIADAVKVERKRCAQIVRARMAVITGNSERDKGERDMLAMILELIERGDA